MLKGAVLMCPLLLFSPFHAEIGPDFHESLVIGDFAPVEAKAYLDLCLGKLNRPGVADDDWRRVHEVGNWYLQMRQSGTPQRCM
jgi:hypothetical protein